MDKQIILESGLSKLELGTHLWLFILKFSSSGRVIKEIIAELETVDKKYPRKFKVVKVLRGTSLKDSDHYYYHGYLGEYLFIKLDYGIDWWNSCLRNKINQIESEAQSHIKKLKNRLVL